MNISMHYSAELPLKANELEHDSTEHLNTAYIGMQTVYSSMGVVCRGMQTIYSSMWAVYRGMQTVYSRMWAVYRRYAEVCRDDTEYYNYVHCIILIVYIKNTLLALPLSGDSVAQW